jgi:enamine deaminase RidA (YjgF/YER057c/UK114 family)
MNEAWEAWVPQGNKPARATVQSALAAPEYKVEIQVVACTY